MNEKVSKIVISIEIFIAALLILCIAAQLMMNHDLKTEQAAAASVAETAVEAASETAVETASETASEPAAENVVQPVAADTTEKEDISIDLNNE